MMDHMVYIMNTDCLMDYTSSEQWTLISRYNIAVDFYKYNYIDIQINKIHFYIAYIMLLIFTVIYVLYVIFAYMHLKSHNVRGMLLILYNDHHTKDTTKIINYQLHIHICISICVTNHPMMFFWYANGRSIPCESNISLINYYYILVLVSILYYNNTLARLGVKGSLVQQIMSYKQYIYIDFDVLVYSYILYIILKLLIHVLSVIDYTNNSINILTHSIIWGAVIIILTGADPFKIEEGRVGLIRLITVIIVSTCKLFSDIQRQKILRLSNPPSIFNKCRFIHLNIYSLLQTHVGVRFLLIILQWPIYMNFLLALNHLCVTRTSIVHVILIFNTTILIIIKYYRDQYTVYTHDLMTSFITCVYKYINAIIIISIGIYSYCMYGIIIYVTKICIWIDDFFETMSSWRVKLGA